MFAKVKYLLAIGLLFLIPACATGQATGASTVDIDATVEARLEKKLAEIVNTSELINKELKNSNLPDEIRIGAVLRENKVIIPRSNFVFQKDDRVVFIVKKDSISFVENIFRLSSV